MLERLVCEKENVCNRSLNPDFKEESEEIASVADVFKVTLVGQVGKLVRSHEQDALSVRPHL